MGLLDYLETSGKQLAQIPDGVRGLLSDWMDWRDQNAGLLSEAKTAGREGTVKALRGEKLTDAEQEAVALTPYSAIGAADLQAPGFLFAGTYLGRNARTADIPALQKAQRLARKGGDAAPGGEIQQKTGWFKNPGDEWQFEISDKDAKLLPHPTDPNQVVLDHPDLTAAHPEIAQMPIHLIDPGHEAKGWYGRGGMHPDTGEAGIRRDLPPEEQLKVALHELGGHAVQDIEGFSGGSSPRANVALSQQLTQSIFDDAKDLWQSGKMTADEALDWAAEQTRGLSSYDLYRRQLGEYAARDIEARMNMTDAERKATPPYSSETHDPADLLTTINPPFKPGRQRRTSTAQSAEPPPDIPIAPLSTDPPDIPIGASAEPPGPPPPHPLIGTTYRTPMEAIEAFHAGGGYAAGIKYSQRGPGHFVIEATGSGAVAPGSGVPRQVGPPTGIHGAPGVANPGGLVVPDPAGAAGVGGTGGTGSAARPPPFARPEPGALPPVAVPAGALTDPEGRLLTAPLIAGIRQPGGVDVPTSMGESRWLANKLFSLGVHDDPEFRTKTGHRGQVSVNRPGTPNTLPDMRMQIHSRLSDEQYPQTFRHEVGHGLDFASERTARTDRLPHSEVNNVPPAVEEELHAASGEMRPDLWQTQTQRAIDYRRSSSELMADGYRYYQEDPQRFKALYPQAAKFIRDIVNEDPVLSQHIQFNVMAPGGGGLLSAPIPDDTEQRKR